RRTDLQRHHEVGEAREQRRREQQQHDRAVHREELVVLLLALHDLDPGLEELRPDHEGHEAADAEEDERRDQVHVPDRLVVGGRDPLDHGPPEGLTPGGETGDDFGLRDHQCSPSVLAVTGFGSWRRLKPSTGIWPSWPFSRSASICASYSARSTTSTLNSIPAWCSPQSSAHLPA